MQDKLIAAYEAVDEDDTGTVPRLDLRRKVCRCAVGDAAECGCSWSTWPSQSRQSSRLWSWCSLPTQCTGADGNIQVKGLDLMVVDHDEYEEIVDKWLADPDGCCDMPYKCTVEGSLTGTVPLLLQLVVSS